MSEEETKRLVQGHTTRQYRNDVLLVAVLLSSIGCGTIVREEYRALDEVNETIECVRTVVDSLSDVQTKGSMIVSITNLLVSMKQLVEETQKLRNAAPKIPSTTAASAQSR